MIPVDQTVLHTDTTNGNCFAASLASILEMPISEIPEFSGPEWWSSFLQWLNGIGFDIAMWREEIQLPGYYLVMGVSPRDPEINHQVVYLNGEMIHDPHPDKTGLAKIKEVMALIPLDPARYTRK